MNSMQLDSTGTHSTADNCINISGRDSDTCPKGEKHADWCYFFTHHTKVEPIVKVINKNSPYRTFVHTFTKEVYKDGKRQDKEFQTISGLVFIQGSPDVLSNYFKNEFGNDLYLARNCSTHRIAIISDDVMEPFMQLMKTDPSRIRFMLNPISHYRIDKNNGKPHPLLRITSGLLKGFEGYVIRINRDRRLVMAIGDMTVAISGIHKENFENVNDYESLLSIANGR